MATGASLGSMWHISAMLQLHCHWHCTTETVSNRSCLAGTPVLRRLHSCRAPYLELPMLTGHCLCHTVMITLACVSLTVALTTTSSHFLPTVLSHGLAQANSAEKPLRSLRLPAAAVQRQWHDRVAVRKPACDAPENATQYRAEVSPSITHQHY